MSTPVLKNTRQTAQHPFHVLTNSKLPILMSISAGCTALIFVAKLHDITYLSSASYSFVVSQIFAPFFQVENLAYLCVDGLLLTFIVLMVVIMAAWSYSLVREASQLGHHTLRVQKALKYGMLLFLVSEAMLFFPFF